MTTGRPARSTTGRGSNGVSNDEDGGQERKCSKETNVFYFHLGRKSVACMVLAMMKMADNKFKSVVRKRTSSISISAGKVLTIAIKATVTTESQCYCG